MLHRVLIDVPTQKVCFVILFFFFLVGGGREKNGREEGRDEGRKEGRKRGGREGGREGREERKSSNERDIADQDLEIYKLISSFLREGKIKIIIISKGEEERGRERGRVNGNIALF